MNSNKFELVISFENMFLIPAEIEDKLEKITTELFNECNLESAYKLDGDLDAYLLRFDIDKSDKQPQAKAVARIFWLQMAHNIDLRTFDSVEDFDKYKQTILKEGFSEQANETVIWH